MPVMETNRLKYALLISLLWCCKLLYGQSPIKGELLVQLKPDARIEKWLSGQNITARSQRGLQLARTLAPGANVHLVRYDTSRFNGSDLLMNFQRQASVLAAQYNYEVEFRTTPDDPEYARQWGLERIQAPAVWEYSTGGVTAQGDSIVIAILDSGFDPSHEDLRENLWRNRDEIPNDGIDNDNNGYTDDYHGWNFLDDDANFPVDRHGQSVAGIAGARGNNQQGVSGVNWETQLMLLAIRSVDEIIEAYEYVVEQRRRYNTSNGAEGAFVVVTNASFGQSDIFCADQPVWGAMYDRLGEVGVLTAAGTANQAFDVDEFGDMPTTCESEFLMTVLNITDRDRRHRSSAFGEKSIDMGAPGEGSYTTQPFDTYGSFNDNSAAAPHLTGSIALLYSLPCEDLAESALTQPAQTAIVLRNALLQGVDPIDNLVGETATGGRLNVFNSMELLQASCDNQNAAANLSLINLYPNPARSTLNIIYQAPEFAEQQLRVFNALGQLIYEQRLVPSRFGEKTEQLPLEGWQPGFYVLEISGQAGEVVRKFVIGE